MKPQTLGVIGLGAIGGSVAWQAAAAGVPRVIGYSPVAKEGVAAARVGAVTEIASTTRDVVAVADLVVLATPPLVSVELLAELAAPLLDRRVISTDVASVKTPIMARATELHLESCFAGSHPFVGTHESGFQAARPDRFVGKIVYVTPAPGGDLAAGEVSDFWQRVMRAQPVRVDAKSHDEQVGWTSHLPQVVASALARTLAAHGPRGVTYGSGAASTTRLAASNVEMWRDILLSNSEAVLAALAGFEGEVEVLRAAIERHDAKTLERSLDVARNWRTRLSD